MDYLKLYDYIISRILPEAMNYIFLDEIQNVTDFQKAVESLFIKPGTDIYITGSNAAVLSGELATMLSGRYVEIKMLPFSFSEYIEFRLQVEENNKNGSEENHFVLSKQELFSDYVRYGAFPYVVALNKDEKNIRDYLDGIYSTVLLKDIVSRYAVADVPSLE